MMGGAAKPMIALIKIVVAILVVLVAFALS
jgi:hypothetical protein